MVGDFHGLLGIDREAQSLDVRRWSEAATDARTKAFETGADGVDAARRLGSQTMGRARSVSGRLTSRLTDRARRRTVDDVDHGAEDA